LLQSLRCFPKVSLLQALQKISAQHGSLQIISKRTSGSRNQREETNGGETILASGSIQTNITRIVFKFRFFMPVLLSSKKQ
jgi:hypothetical protein